MSTEPVGDTDTPEGAARIFVEAIAWGEHRRVWDMLGPEGRRTVLRVAVSRGMAEALAGRIRDGTASGREQDDFLADLVNGLRADLQGADIDALEYELGPEAPTPGSTRVVLVSPLPEPALLGPGLPAGSIEFVREGDRWLVERLVPQVAR